MQMTQGEASLNSQSLPFVIPLLMISLVSTSGWREHQEELRWRAALSEAPLGVAALGSPRVVPLLQLADYYSPSNGTLSAYFVLLNRTISLMLIRLKK
jgi:hypothetical protein